jgi:hypothetical protein
MRFFIQRNFSCDMLGITEKPLSLDTVSSGRNTAGLNKKEDV